MDKVIDYLNENYNQLKDLNVIQIKQSLKENGFEIEGDLGNCFRKDSKGVKLEEWIRIQVLLHNNKDEEAKKINADYVKDLIDLDRCHPKDGFIEVFSFGDYNTKDLLKREGSKPTGTRSDFYEMASKPRGICLLINNYFTIGTYKEMSRFRNIFYQLHFDVIMKKNQTAQQIKDLLESISQKVELVDHDSFVFMIITHGTPNEEVLGFDRIPLKIKSLVSLFDNKSCEGLQNKPKMFFFNCCRGANTDNGIESEGTLANPIQTNNVIKQLLPTSGDIIVCYSTLEGYVAHVYRSEGTKFGKALADAFVERVWDHELNGILRKARRELKTAMQLENKQQSFEWNQSTDKQVFFDPTNPNIVDIQ